MRSEMLTVKIRDIIYESIMVENILSIRVFEWTVTLVDCKINCISKLEVRQTKNSLV